MYENIINVFHGIPSSSSLDTNDVLNDDNPINEISNKNTETTNLIDTIIDINQNFHSHENSGNINNGQNNNESTYSSQKNNLLKLPSDKNSNSMKTTAINNTYEIFVSPFHISMTSELITQHIMENTSLISSDLFNVTPLIKSTEQLKRKNYISFKITTLKKDICETLLDSNLWPNHEAKIFSEKKKNINNGKNVRFDNNKKNTPFKLKPNSPYSKRFNTKSDTFPRNNYNLSNTPIRDRNNNHFRSRLDQQQHIKPQHSPNYPIKLIPYIPTPNSLQISDYNQNFLYNHNVAWPPIIQQQIPIHPHIQQQNQFYPTNSNQSIFPNQQQHQQQQQSHQIIQNRQTN